MVKPITRPSTWSSRGLLLAIAVAAVALGGTAGPAVDGWSPEEIKTLRSLWIGSLGPLPHDPTNRVADDPTAASLGSLLFNDTGFSANGRVSCASCHQPQDGFTDHRPIGKGIGVGKRRTMPIPAAIYSPWQFWDGRADSLWAQATGPTENPVEHGSTRTEIARRMQTRYADWYRRVFGPFPAVLSQPYPERASPVGNAAERAAWASMPVAQQDAVNEVFANFGKAVAAFERTLRLPKTRFDNYVAALVSGASTQALMNPDERAGLRLFIGKGQCTRCHNGPLLTNNHFANTGVPPRPGLPDDVGRSDGITLALANAFNCRGRFNDKPGQGCDELDFAILKGPELQRAFKVPSLRGVADRAPYMHQGQFGSLERVVQHYSTAPAAISGKSEIHPLNLSREEQRQLVAFLRTLSAPPAKASR